MLRTFCKQHVKRCPDDDWWANEKDCALLQADDMMGDADWALDPNSSGDDQIILLIVVSIAARQAKESFGLDERVSSVIYTVIKALSVAWVSLYWLPDVAEKLGLDV